MITFYRLSDGQYEEIGKIVNGKFRDVESDTIKRMVRPNMDEETIAELYSGPSFIARLTHE